LAPKRNKLFIYSTFSITPKRINRVYGARLRVIAPRSTATCVYVEAGANRLQRCKFWSVWAQCSNCYSIWRSVFYGLLYVNQVWISLELTK